MTRRLASVAFLVLLAGCVQQQASMPPPPQGVKQIVVPKPANRTQSPLVVDDPGWLDKMLAADPTHVLPSLKTEVRRWEPYSADWSLVVVDVVASLEDPQGGRTIWSVERTDWRIPTRDARSSREASIAAATTIAETLVAGWQPADTRPIDEDDEED